MPLRLKLVTILCFLSSCAHIDNYEATDLKKNQYQVFGEVYETMSSAEGYLEIGVASWYGKNSMESDSLWRDIRYGIDDSSS